MQTGRHQGMTTNERIAMDNKCYEKIKAFNYFEFLIMNQDSIYEDIYLILLMLFCQNSKKIVLFS